MIVIVDIDHTLADSYWRDDLLERCRMGKAEWDEYYQLGSGDEPNKTMIDLIDALSTSGWTVVAVTGRPEKWRQATTRWLADHEASVDEILMRPDADYRRSPELKLGLVMRRFPGMADVGLVIDDRGDVCSVFREAGITTLTVNLARRPKP